MQVSYFTSGGFVAHKVSLACTSLIFSVWCDTRGHILEIEAFTSAGKPHPLTLARAKGEVGQALKLLCFRIAAQKVTA